MGLNPAQPGPNLYDAVYEVIDAAKGSGQPLKLYKGSHGAPDPHPVVRSYAQFLADQQRGILGYACATTRPGADRYHAADLAQYDAEHRPRVSTQSVLNLLASSGRRGTESVDDYLTYVATRRHKLGAYRGGSSGLEDESRAAAAAYFRCLGHDTHAGEVQVYCGGFKGALISLCAAVMTSRDGDTLRHQGGRMLAAVGYYQSLRLIGPIFGAGIDVVPELDGPTVTDWLDATRGEPRRIVYAPLVNNADGRVLSVPQACEIAAAVLEHNRRNPDAPVWVVGDDVYAGSLLEPRPAWPIGTVTGSDLGDPGLGRMSDWTVSIVTPSKTVAVPTARVAFATTRNAAMRRAMAHYRTVFSLGRVPQFGELPGVAALCLTPQAWIDEWNDTYRRRLEQLRAELRYINSSAGQQLFDVPTPEGGWYFELRVSRDLVPGGVLRSGVDAAATLLHYDPSRLDSGLAMLPGELFGHGLAGPDRWLRLRGTVAISDTDLAGCAARLGHATEVLRSPDGPQVAAEALRRARSVADLDRILACRRF